MRDVEEVLDYEYGNSYVGGEDETPDYFGTMPQVAYSRNRG